MSEIKPFSGVDDRTRLADVIPLSTPFTLNIFPSNVCNFKCSYCAQSLDNDVFHKEYGVKKEIMSMDIIDRVVEQSKEFDCKYKLVSMMGHGEPLCNKEIPEMIKKIRIADIAERTDIITNASLLTNDMADRLIDAGLDVLRISLQGISSESYKKTSNADLDFDKFYSNIEYFYKKSDGRCKVYVKTMDVSLKDDETQKFYNMFSNVSDRMYIDKVKPVYSKVEYTDDQKNITVDRYGNTHERRIVCPHPFYTLSVWPSGDVSACCALYRPYILGNVGKENLSQMWMSDLHKKFCMEQLSGERFTNPDCRKCCAPDDVAHKEDILDDRREKLLSFFSDTEC